MSSKAKTNSISLPVVEFTMVDNTAAMGVKTVFNACGVDKA